MIALFTAAALPLIILPFAVVDTSIYGGAATPELLPPQPSTEEQAGQEKLHPLSSAARSKAALSRVTKTPNIGYDASVVMAMKEMGLVTDHFDAWIEQHPGTAIVHIKYMPVLMQQSVASTSLFIRKSNAKIDEKTAWREAAALVHYSAKYGVPYALTTAVAHVESTFNPAAVSPKGAAGVMQVMWRIHNQLLQANGIQPTPGSNPLADPEQAIAAGCLLISRYIKAYGSVQTAMERYYGGRSLAYQRKVNRNIASVLNHHAQLFKFFK